MCTACVEMENLRLKSLTCTEYSQLLDWRDEVQVGGKEIHKCTRVNHKHKHAEPVQPHLFPEKTPDKQ